MSGAAGANPAARVTLCGSWGGQASTFERQLLYDGYVGHDIDTTDPLQQVLAEYLEIPGMKAAILVSDEGLTISSATDGDVDASSVAALVIDTVTTVQRFGLHVAAGFLDTMTIDFEDLSVVLAPFTPDVMLALVAERGAVGGCQISPFACG